MSSNLIQDATNHLNGRQRGREARLARLAAGGVPVETDGMRRWLSDQLDAQLEAEGGLYYVCTTRISAGVDADLPTLSRWGCRIVRMPIVATEQVDEDGDRVFVVQWGSAGPGYLAPTFDYISSTAEEAYTSARSRLLTSGECFQTRAEAVAAVTRMLHARASR